MKVYSINSAPKNNYSSTKVKNSQPTFSAMRFSSGCYSDWFVSMIKQHAVLPEAKRLLEEKSHFSFFYHQIDDSAGLFESDAKRLIRAEIRKRDYKDLLKDILRGEQGVKIEDKVYDSPTLRFSSLGDYNRNHKSFKRLDYDPSEHIASNEGYPEIDLMKD